VKIKQNEKSTNGGVNWSEAIDGPRKHEQSIVAGIGATISRLGIECRYVGSTGFSPYGSSGIGVRSLQLIATCRL
ncbi:MAG TPA: hypothetical protein VJ720_03085, partial [Chitinophaga sp.]|nr:hypothetical protein [Chitinophaga sp.]